MVWWLGCGGASGLAVKLPGADPMLDLPRMTDLLLHLRRGKPNEEGVLSKKRVTSRN